MFSTLTSSSLFNGFFLGGLECSTQRLRSGKRLDVLRDTRHEEFAEQDYARLKQAGLNAIRSGLRWHRIETSPGVYDFSFELPRIRAARKANIQVIWDLMHFGWPDGLDIFSPRFITRFVNFAREFAKLLRNETDATPFICPINEISFHSWAGGEAAILNPFALFHGDELKAQLVRAAIQAMEVIWQILPDARMAHAEPTIHIIADLNRPHERDEAEGWRLAQYQTWDMLCGRLKPELGGHEKYLDILGVNFYPDNQWILRGPVIQRGNPAYRPLRHILHEIHARYSRPVFVAETGAEDDIRPGWLRYVVSEVVAALQADVPIEGVCLYPIFNHPGWENDRHCHNGLWDYADDNGNREVFTPLANELREQRQVVEAALRRRHERTAANEARRAQPV